MLAHDFLCIVTALVAALFVGLAPRPAHAGEPRRVALTWIAEPSCPSGDAVVAEVERLVQGSPPKDVIIARAEVVHESSWQVRLETHSGELRGKRQVEAESCAQLADATALILALMIDPTAASRAPESRAVDAPLLPVEPRSRTVSELIVPPAPTTPTPRPAALPRPVPPAASPRPVVAASVLGDGGTLPAPALGVGASGGLLLGAYRFTADLGYFPTRTALLAERSPAGGDFTLITGALAACRAMLTLGPARAALCVGGALDTVLATGFGVRSPQSGSASWGALLAAGLVEVPIAGPVAAELRVAGVVPFARPPFYFDGLGTLYRPSAVGLRLGLGLTARF